MGEYSPAKTGEYPRIFPSFQNCAHCVKDLMDNKDNSLHLGRKYARIFVLGHYLFLVQVATMVYKSIHGLAPDYLGSLFTKYDPPYNLRSFENKLAVPLPRTNFLKNSFSYNGAVIWNSLSPKLRHAKSLQSFRNGCRDFF